MHIPSSLSPFRNRPIIWRLALLTLSLLLFALDLSAQVYVVREAAPDQPPMPRRINQAEIEVRKHSVEVNINRAVAVTRVEQEFFNPGGRDLEGDYLFPVPAGAAIEKFEMIANGKRLEAELLPAAKAREIYEEIVRSRRDPALLEYAGRDLYRVRLFPIAAGKSSSIIIDYREILRAEGGGIGYRYPLSTGKYAERPAGEISVRVEADMSMPVAACYSPSHAITVERPAPDRVRASWKALRERQESDFQIVISTTEDPVAATLLAHKPDGAAEGWFLMLLAAGGAESGERFPKDVVFVCDTSGSMAGAKIEQARRALAYCIDNLDPADRFDVIRFSTEAEPLFDELKVATTENRAAANRHVESFRPRGGTAIGAAMDAALALPGSPDRVRVVLFLTDGLPTIGETSLEQLTAKAAKTGGPRFFVFGVGQDVNTRLLDRIAEGSRAFATYVGPKEDIEMKVTNFFDRIQEPALVSPHVEISGIRVSQVHPKTLPDLFRGDHAVVVGRYREGGSAQVELSGQRGDKRFVKRHDLSFPEKTGENEFIPRFWAGRRIGFLLDEMRDRGENSELVGEITQLAREYGIVTPHTAQLILEDEARRNVPLERQTLRDLSEARSSAQAPAGAFSAGIRSFTSGWVSRAGDRGSEARSGEVLANDTGSRGLASGAVNNALKWESAPFAQQKSAQDALVAALGSGETEQQAAVVINQSAQRMKRASGRTFVQNAAQWIDTAAQQKGGTGPQRVKFGSAEYFQLLSDHPDVSEAFALGRELLIVIGGNLYEIHDAT